MRYIHQLLRPVRKIMTSHTKQVSTILTDSVRKGFTDGANYDSYRPDYTDETTDQVMRMLALEGIEDKHKDSTILELGAGTGKFTLKLTAKIPQNVKYIASEPMSDFWRTLQKNCPKVKTLQCATENIPLVDSSVQGIVSAQAFHWFSNKQALDEMYRILEPGANLVLLWNFNDRKVDWIDKLLTIIDTNRADPCRYHGYEWKTAIDEHPGFQFVDQKITQGTVVRGDVEFLLGHFSTHSSIHKLDPIGKNRELGKIRDILLTHPDTKDLTIIEFPFSTDIYHYKRVSKS